MSNYDFRASNSQTINLNGWQITESFKPHQQWVLESSDQVIYLTWEHSGKIDVNLVTDDDEEHDQIPTTPLGSYLNGIDSRLKLSDIQAQLEDE